MLEHLDLLLQLRIDVLGALIFELVLELFDLALLVLELLLQFRVFGSRFVPSLLRLFELPAQFDFDGGRARLGGLVGFVGSAGRDIVVRCTSLGELLMRDKRGRGSALLARILNSEAQRPVKQGVDRTHLGREFCDLFLQLFDHATSADFVERVSLLRKGGKNGGREEGSARGDDSSSPGLSGYRKGRAPRRRQHLERGWERAAFRMFRAERLTFWFTSCSFKFLISISISSTSLAARRSFSRLVCVTCALSLLFRARAYESVRPMMSRGGGRLASLPASA